MSAEQLNPTPPKRDYTFFPTEEERKLIGQADPEELAVFMLTQPEMAPSFLHELWRTHREQDMYITLGLVKDNREVMVSALGIQMAASICVMRGFYREPPEVCQTFLVETLTIINKVNFQVPLNGELSQGQKQSVDHTAGIILSCVQAAIQSSRAGLN